MSSQTNQPIDPDNYLDIQQLQIGLHICLDMAWVDHNFRSSNFTIKSEAQINTLRLMKLDKVRYDPLKSLVEPLPKTDENIVDNIASNAKSRINRPLNSDQLKLEVPDTEVPDTEVPKPGKTKPERVAQIKLHRESAIRVEKQFSAAANTVKSIGTDIFSQPDRTVNEASELIRKLSSSMGADMDVAIHVMHEKAGTKEIYYHALNTVVLCLMVGRNMELSANDLHMLGLGALFHDIGTLDLPSSILLKKEPLTTAEVSFYQQHCNYGVKIGMQALLPEEVIEIIQNHHEHIDGSGYPNGLIGGGSENARIVGLVSAYDDLCNQNNTAKSLTPHAALSMMFSLNRGKYDVEILNTFIRCMGVYPPGTLAVLSNGMTCIVTSVNYDNPLRPIVLVYDAAIPKKEAIVLDLEKETDISIANPIEQSTLSNEVLDYLSPRSRFV